MDDEIETILSEHKKKSATEIANILLTSTMELADPDQDNISITVVKVNHTNVAAETLPIASDIGEEDADERGGAMPTRVIQFASGGK